MSLKNLTNEQIELIEKEIKKNSEEIIKKRLKEDPEYRKRFNELITTLTVLEDEFTKMGYTKKDLNPNSTLLKSEGELVPTVLKHFDILKYTNNKKMLLGFVRVKGINNAAEGLIERFYDDNNVALRDRIAEAIGEIQDKDFVDEYIKIIENDKFGVVRVYIATMLGKMKVVEAIPALKTLAKEPKIQALVIDALAKYKDPSLSTFFRKFLDSDDKRVRGMAEKGIRYIDRELENKKEALAQKVNKNMI